MGFLERRPGLSEFLQGLACMNSTDGDDQLCNRLPDKTKCECRGITKRGWEYCRKNKVNTLGKTYNVDWLLVEGVDIFGLKGFQHISGVKCKLWSLTPWLRLTFTFYKFPFDDPKKLNRSLPPRRETSVHPPAWTLIGRQALWGADISRLPSQKETTPL